jgi:hypothetical protein
LSPEVLIPTLFGAIGALFGLYSIYLRNRIGQLEEENNALEKENRTYVSLFMDLKSGDAATLERVLRRVAYMLRGGVDPFDTDR